MRLADEPAGTNDVFWEIKDDAQHTVLRTSQPQPTALLGARALRRHVRDARSPLRSTFEVKAGETRTIEIGG